MSYSQWRRVITIVGVLCLYISYATPGLRFDSCCLQAGASHTFTSSRDATAYSTDKFISCVVPCLAVVPPLRRGEEIVIAWTQEKTTTLGGIEPHHSS